MSAPDNEKLSEEHQELLRVGLAFLDSEDCRQYSSRRISNDLGNFEAAANEGARIMEEHGEEFYRNLIGPLISHRT